MEQIKKKRSLVLTRKGVTRLHLMLSVSLVSFLLAYYYNYDYCSVLTNYIELAYYLIELLLTHGINKMYVFLIFNGILVVLVKTAGSLISQSSFDPKEHMYVKNIHDGLYTQCEDVMVEDEELVIRVDGSEKNGIFVMENVGETIEELNKRFDEFIRMKKEEIMSDADQHVMFPYD